MSDLGRLDGPFRRWLLPDEHVLALVSEGTVLAAPPGNAESFIATQAAFVDARNHLVRIEGARPMGGPTGQAFALVATSTRLLSILGAEGEPDRVLTASLAAIQTNADWTPGESSEGHTFERRPGTLRLSIRTTEGAWSPVVGGIERRHAEALAELFRARLRWTTTGSGSAPRAERAAEQVGLLLIGALFGWIAAVAAVVAIDAAFPGLPGGWQAPAIGLAPLAAFAIDWVARAIIRFRQSDREAAPRPRFGPVGRTVLWALAWTVAFALAAATLR